MPHVEDFKILDRFFVENFEGLYIICLDDVWGTVPQNSVRLSHGVPGACIDESRANNIIKTMQTSRFSQLTVCLF